jgi:hypothetical protein
MEINRDSYQHHDITLPVAPDISGVIFLTTVMTAGISRVNIRLLTFIAQTEPWK